jgi:acetyl-CoA C-acetyltransferase
MKEAVIVAAMRTPLGSFGGVLSGFSAIELGAKAIQGVMANLNLDASLVDEVYMGNVCQANLGQNPAKQAAIAAGLGPHIPSTTLNKVCASGTKAIMLAAQAVMLGQADVVLAGGFESMSNVPYYVPKARYGYKYGHGEFLDGLVRDGLEDAYVKRPMGTFADATAKHYGITRETQDAFTVESYNRAQAATADGSFASEIIPVMVPQRKGEPKAVTTDEEPGNVIFDKIPTLRPAFTPDGTATAANSSTINDGASCLVIMSAEKAMELGYKPLARIIGFADHEQEPEWFTTAPAEAIKKALKRADLQLSDINLMEVNEAFSVVPLAVGQLLEADMSKMNIRGGAVALGHPLGCSGARIVTTLTHAMHDTSSRYGVAGICNGGGGSSAIVLENLG